MKGFTVKDGLIFPKAVKDASAPAPKPSSGPTPSKTPTPATKPSKPT